MNLISTELHLSQRDVYVDQLLNTESPHYNIGGYIKLKGILDKEKFLKTVSSAAKVFDAFKMRFDPNAADSEFYADTEFDCLNVTELDFSGREDAAKNALFWMQNRFNIHFTIQKDSFLFEHSLLKISEDEYWFFGRYHHLITDGFGFIVFVQYVARKYKSLISGVDEEFIYPSYIAEAEKSSQYFNTAAFDSDRKYWEEKINEQPSKILQRKYLDQSSGNTSSRYIYKITGKQKELLDETILNSKSGLLQLTIAALMIYFGKITDEDEIVFGIPVHKRGSKVLRNIVGMFSGILPFKGTFSSDCILSDLLKEITQSQKNDYRHQSYPLSEITRGLKGRASEDYLYEISINYEPLNFDLDFGKDLSAEIFRLESDHERNPLQFFWRDYGNLQPMQLIINYSNEYFNKEEIELLTQRILFIIEQFSTGLEKNAGSISIIPGSESELLEKFNETAIVYPGEKNLVKLFEEQAEKSPDIIALDFHEQHLTYRELNERSNQIAHYLISKGVKKESLIPICIERSIEMLTGILGILKAGAAYVPVDPEYPEERIRYILEDTQASIVLSSKKSSLKLPDSKEVSVISLDGDQSLIKRKTPDNIGSYPEPGNLAYVIYTSGSTGRPKGVMIEHHSVVNLINAQSSYFKIKSGERILQFSNYCFDASVEQMFIALLNGASLVLFKEGLQLNAEGFENLLNEKRVIHLHATPSFLENLNPDSYKYLKRVIAGGDVCKKELSEKWKNKVSFYNEYGPTETTVTAIEYHDNSVKENNISLPVGKPLANIKVYILNKNNELCPVCAPGEICIAGDCLARGYLNLQVLTAEKFIENPFSDIPGSRIYRTGDLGRRLTDGNIEYLGRTDEQLKIRGYRIEPGEIESVLMDSEQVENVLVIARPDGSGNKRLIAYVIPHGKFDAEVIQNFLKRKLPDYMIPALWVEMKSFPLTPNGKIDKNSLPETDSSDLIKTEYAAPENELEAKLSEMWKDILKEERAGVNDNFFELGGHSLNAIQLSSRLHKELNIKTDISTIFSNPTIRKLAKALSAERENQFIEIKKLPEADYYELSHSQKRFWILSNFKNGSEAYNVSNVFIIEGDLNINAFETAFDKVIERHEILRTVFVEVEGDTKQKILPVNETGFKTEEFDFRNTDDAEIKIRKWLEEDSRRPFDLNSGPLLRVTLFREADDKYILVFNIHHIISDGWSKAILVKEFLHYYKAYSGDVESDLPSLKIQYKDYAAWHNDSIDRQGQYWRELYEKEIPVLNFPVDFERPKVLSYFGEMIQQTITEDLTISLHKLAAEQNMSLNNLLLTLYGLLVAMHSGQEEVVIGSVSSGRSHPDLEKLIGVFINFLPIKLSPDKYLKLSEYLRNSLDTLMKVYDNQEYPFDRIVEDCIKKRDISRNPLFDTMINFQLEEDLSGKVNSEMSKTGISIKPYHSMKEDLFQSVLDFKLDVIPEGGKLGFFLSYNSKLFTKKRMTGFLNDFTELLVSAVKKQDSYLSQYGVWAEGKNKSDRAEYDNEPDTENSKMPVNICASFIIEPVKEYMEYWAKEFELNIKVNIAPYNQVFQQLLDPGSLLHGSKGMNILFIRIEDWLRDKKDLPDDEKINFLDETYSELTKIIEDTGKKIFIPFLAGVVPVYSDSAFSTEVITHIKHLSKELEIFLNGQPLFQLLDLEKIAGLYDVAEVYDKTSDELGHIPFTQEYYAALGTYLMRKVSAFMNPSYKVIALDCDNTLWKGICGELGAMNVIIDENYSALQEFFLEKYKEGFLLALCSKNNEEDVWEVFDNHPGMRLKREHISAYRINWGPKPENILEISKELNLGINSFIFTDDNEFETEQMSLNCPDVLSLTLPEQPENFSEFLNHIWAFDYFRITDEDRKRNEMYKTEKQRKEEENKFGTLDDFLKSLEIRVEIRDISPKDIERAVQLSMRTNQFNLNGVRKTAEEIAATINDENHFSRIIEVKDRFGEYGIVGLVLAKENDNALILETFLLSCRVLGRNVEGISLSEIQNHCMKRGLDTITALFKQTAKNKPFQEFLSGHEWIPDSENESYNLFLKKAEQIPA